MKPETLIAISNEGYRNGIATERERIIKLLAETKDETLCTCHGCEEWLNALDYVIARIENKCQ